MPQIYKEEVSDLMKRILSGVSQRKLGKMVGVTQTYISNIKDGLIPSKEIAIKIAEASREFGIGVTDWEMLSVCGYVPERLEDAFEEMLDQKKVSPDAKAAIMKCLVEVLSKEGQDETRTKCADRESK